MAKFAQLTKGRRARKRGVPFSSLDGVEMTVDLAVLSGEDHGLILEFAASFARERNGEPKSGDPLFEFGRDVKTVHLSAIDPESSEEKPEAFFSSTDEVLAGLDRDRIQLLAEKQRTHQDVVSPYQQAMSSEQFFANIAQIAEAEEGDDLPFETWAPSLRLSFVRTTARWLIEMASSASQTPKSPTTSGAEGEGKASSIH